MSFLAPTPPPRNRPRLLDQSVIGTSSKKVDTSYLGSFEQNQKIADEEGTVLNVAAGDQHHHTPGAIISPRPPPPPQLPTPHELIIVRSDPRPYVLGVPRTTERSRRRAQYHEDLGELHRRQQRASVVGAALENKHDLLCEWAAGAFVLVNHSVCKSVDEHLPALKSSTWKHFLSVAEELYIRQLKNHHEEIEVEEARQWRHGILFGHRREVFVFSLSVRRALRKFVLRWVAVRRARIITARLRREDLASREARCRVDVLQTAAIEGAECMMGIIVQLADITKTRLIAFLQSIQRGVWCGSLAARETLERRRIYWGVAAPIPPVKLLLRCQKDLGENTSATSAAGAAAAAPTRGLLVSLQCAEIANRDSLTAQQAATWTALVRFMQRSTVEDRCDEEKQLMFDEAMEDLTRNLLPRAQFVLHYHSRRDVEEDEFETRQEYSGVLLEMLDADVQASVAEMRAEAQARIRGLWQRHCFKQQRRAHQLRVLREVMRQERECEALYVHEALTDLYVECAAEALATVVEPSFRKVIDDALYSCGFLPAAAIHRHGQLDARLYAISPPELAAVAQFLHTLHISEQLAREGFAENERQSRRDISAEEDDDWTQHFKINFSLAVRFVGKLEDIHRVTEVNLATEEEVYTPERQVKQQQELLQFEAEEEAAREKLFSDYEERFARLRRKNDAAEEARLQAQRDEIEQQQEPKGRERVVEAEEYVRSTNFVARHEKLQVQNRQALEAEYEVVCRRELDAHVEALYSVRVALGLFVVSGGVGGGEDEEEL